MSSYKNNEQEDQIPALIPLNKKKGADVIPLATPSQKNSASGLDSFAAMMKNQVKKTPTPREGQQGADKSQVDKREVDAEKISDFEKKSREKILAVNKKDGKVQNEHSKENQKSKYLIAEMLNKISVKNLTEELYPVSNEVIEQVLEKIDDEIAEYMADAQKKQNSLNVNPYNMHLKKQLEQVKREIDHCTTIRQLYHEKINSRNKIQILEGQIIKLRNDNRDLKVKVSRGIEQIESYKHNLPCQRQKQLKEKLSVCELELKKQKEMRQSLEDNIDSIILNFKKLYEEADKARNIVTKKLREIEERERKIKKEVVESEEEPSDELNAPVRRVTTIEQQMGEDKRNLGSSYLQSNNDPYPTNYRKHNYQELKTTQGYRNNSYNNNEESGKRSYQPTNMKKSTTKKEEKNEPLSLEERINKMRNNQNLMRKIYPN